jgi:hypothetical protein
MMMGLMLLQSTTSGEQEAAFEEVVLTMENGMNEDAIEARSSRGGQTSEDSYQYFQELIRKSSEADNPLGFRSVMNSHEMESLHNIFLFIRKCDLSASAGMYDIHVYYTCVLYVCIIRVYYTCVLYMCIIHVYYTCVLYMYNKDMYFKYK